ncbi:Hypothetical protein TPAR_01705 [Tolypocladium paradoxum]|uniref:Secreted protein n=1 Tax=Tolypocladium paradoxum TaxID=94208 RepID=A0A2S4L6M1_9HYPO|nr:Hypothetical protein TPAR_01705 [Tolypocladium paradoxum]
MDLNKRSFWLVCVFGLRLADAPISPALDLPRYIPSIVAGRDAQCPCRDVGENLVPRCEQAPPSSQENASLMCWSRVVTQHRRHARLLRPAQKYLLVGTLRTPAHISRSSRSPPRLLHPTAHASISSCLSLPIPFVPRCPDQANTTTTLVPRQVHVASTLTTVFAAASILVRDASEPQAPFPASLRSRTVCLQPQTVDGRTLDGALAGTDRAAPQTDEPRTTIPIYPTSFRHRVAHCSPADDRLASTDDDPERATPLFIHLTPVAACAAASRLPSSLLYATIRLPRPHRLARH